MMDRVQKAVQLFNSGYNCSQAVFAAFSEPAILEQPAALKAASGFGGGIARSGNLCGAVTGAIMAIGLQLSTADAADKTTQSYVYQKVRHFMEKYNQRTGSIVCRDLLGFDMTTPEGQIVSKMPGAFDRCTDFVRIAAEILEEMTTDE